jgi:hypothetical protein
LRKYQALKDFAIPEDISSTRVGLSLDYDARDYKLYFSEGLSFRANVQREVVRSNDEESVGQYDAQITWQIAVVRNQALQLLTATNGLGPTLCRRRHGLPDPASIF